MIKRFLRELYLLPRGEKRAVLLLSLLLILVLSIRVALQLIPDREPPGTDDFFRQAGQILLAIQEADTLQEADALQEPGAFSHTPSVPFPPGRASEKRIRHPPPREPITININAADSSGLLPLPGIGPVLAGRIIKYRNLLGGFVAIDQLQEVYGLKPETFEIVSRQVCIDSTAFFTMRLDTLGFGEILRHPYLELDDVKRIVDFRNFNGGVHLIDEIHEHALLPDSTLKRIAPYLDFDR